MDEALITILLADPGVAELSAARVYAGGRPPRLALPAVVLQRISGGPVYADDGEVGLEKARIQTDCWAMPAPSCWCGRSRRCCPVSAARSGDGLSHGGAGRARHQFYCNPRGELEAESKQAARAFLRLKPFWVHLAGSLPTQSKRGGYGLQLHHPPNSR